MNVLLKCVKEMPLIVKLAIGGSMVVPVMLVGLMAVVLVGCSRPSTPPAKVQEAIPTVAFVAKAEPTKAEPVVQAVPVETISVKADTVWNAYQDNAALADVKYRGKTLKLTCHVWNVKKPRDGEGFIVFERTIDNTECGCYILFPQSAAASVADLHGFEYLKSSGDTFTVDAVIESTGGFSALEFVKTPEVHFKAVGLVVDKISGNLKPKGK